MVESTHDEIKREVIYGYWRDDKEAEKGYSREIVSAKLSKKYWDDLDNQPDVYPGCDTILKHFQRNVAENGDSEFYGFRTVDNEGNPGPYTWRTFVDLDEVTQNFARGIRELDLSPEVEGEGKMWRFFGIWSKNRWEWLSAMLSNMYVKTTTVGFFDAMGN